jgi:hypothetical protein
MKLIYKPDDDKPAQVYDFEPSKLLSAEAEAIEDLKARWDTFEEFGQLFLKGNAKAHRAALWVMMRRVNPAVRFEDLNYPLAALRITFSDEESEKFIESIRKNPDLDKAQQDYLIQTLDLEIYEGEMSDGTDLKGLAELRRRRFEICYHGLSSGLRELDRWTLGDLQDALDWLDERR